MPPSLVPPALKLGFGLMRLPRIGGGSDMDAPIDVPQTARMVDAFLAAGHVCTVTGPEPYRRLTAETGRPIAITGFTPREILLGIAAALRLLGRMRTSSGKSAGLFNAYPASVHPDGAPDALRLIDETFVVCDQVWRGLGAIPESGLAIRSELAEFDAAIRFPITDNEPDDAMSAGGTGCISDRILLGLALPSDCPHFAKDCTPLTPLGAPMVSAEGACAAFHLHRHP